MKNDSTTVMYLTILSTGIMFLFLLLAIGSPKKDVIQCQQEENALYELRWAKRCYEVGEQTAMCKLPLKDVRAMGWDDHVQRAEACKR
jgi:hypothetical protein